MIMIETKKIINYPLLYKIIINYSYFIIIIIDNQRSKLLIKVTHN